MFIRIITVPVKKMTFENLDQIKSDIEESVFPALKQQEGWIRTVIISNKATSQFKIITYWSSKEQASAYEEEKPKLPIMSYIQIGKFAEYFENENLTIEYFDHLVTIEDT